MGGERSGLGPSARRRQDRWLGRLLLSAALLGPPAALAAGPPAQLAQAGPVAFSIPAQSVDGALAAFSAATRVQVLTQGAVTRGVRSPGVSGTLPPQEALGRLLAGTGLAARFLNADTVTVERIPAPGAAVQLDPVQIEGRMVRASGALQPLPEAYAGGQVARGGRLGALGNVDMMDAPFSITSYTAETIRRQQAETIGDVLENDPGVRRGYGYGNFSEQFIIRGFPLYADDIAVNGLYGLAPRQIVATEMYERVEVIKGANAFLNGAAPGGSGIGGGVNLVPKRAGDSPLTRVTASFANDGRPGLAVDVGRRFGPAGEFGVRANAAVREGRTAIDGEERSLYLGSIGLDYRGDRARVSLDLGSQRQRVDQGRPVVFVEGTAVPDAPSARSNYGPSWAYSEMTDTFGQIRAEFDIARNITVYGAIGARQMQEEGEYASPTVTSANGDGRIGRLYVPREDTAVSGQLGVTADIATGPVNHRFNVGTSVLRTVNRNAYEFGAQQPFQLYDFVSPARPPATLAAGDFDSPPRVSDSLVESLYLSDSLSILDDRLSLTVGVRAQRLHIRGYNRVGRNADYDQSAVTPVVGVVFKPWSTVSIYANRIEGLAQGPTAPTAAVNAGQIFAPFKSTQYEIGAKVDFGTIGGSLAVFQTRQPTGLTDPVTRVFDVAGEQRNRGIELTLFGEPVQGLRILGGATLLKAELTDTPGGVDNGNDAVGAPEYQVNIGAEWTLPFLPELAVSGRMVHTGPQYLNTANTLKIPSWTRFDVGARYTTELANRTVVFGLFVENVANNGYWASASGGYLTQGYPLTAKFSASVDF
ncbi:TonB-dependent receptor [Allostella vacuolata]|nr:TonB-dependent receptor [Stella vacuolata]